MRVDLLYKLFHTFNATCFQYRLYCRAAFTTNVLNFVVHLYIAQQPYTMLATAFWHRLTNSNTNSIGSWNISRGRAVFILNLNH